MCHYSDSDREFFFFFVQFFVIFNSLVKKLFFVRFFSLFEIFGSLWEIFMLTVKIDYNLFLRKLNNS